MIYGIILVGWLLNGYALQCLWFWFIMPILDIGIGLEHAMGLLVFSAVLQGRYKERFADHDLRDDVIAAGVAPLLAIVAGLLMRLAMPDILFGARELWP